MKYLALFVFMVISLSSCGVTLQKYNNLMDLKVGSKLEDDLKRFEEFLPDEYQELATDSDMVLMMFVGTSHIDIIRPPQTNSMGHMENRSENYTDHTPYYLIYKAGKLVHWGFAYEILRDNPEYFDDLNKMNTTNY